MSNLDQIWLLYLNMRTQLVESAIANGLTDVEIIAGLTGEESVKQITELLHTARTYIKVKNE